MSMRHNFPRHTQKMVASFFTIRAIVTTSMIFLAIPFSNASADAQYTVCSYAYACGSVKNFSYPFWGGDRPQFCGHHGFQLDCPSTSDYPSIKFKSTEGRSDEKAKVLSINTSTHKMGVALDRFLERNSTCPNKLNFSLTLPTMYNLSPSVANVSLFYGCPSSVSKYQHASFNCSYHNGTKVTAFYFSETSDKIRRLVESCEINNTFPVLQTGLNKLHNRDAALLSILRKGFEMEYMVNFKICSTCEKSGGKCGSSKDASSKFLCYCPDGPQASICHISAEENSGVMKVLAISGGIILVTVLLIAIWHRKKLKCGRSRLFSRSASLERTPSSDRERGNQHLGLPLFSYRELEEATNNFHKSRVLGVGGFGTVYYGKLRDGREVAVKHLFERSYKRVQQFLNEVQILTYLRHQNLVSLYGCTSQHCKELLLVYEYVPNGTVADHLYGDKAKIRSLPWPVRMRIAVETAIALSHLHSSDIIHRDVKTNNILLDNNFSVKVADFGLSRLLPNNVTHVSTAPQGTPGYVDPLYHQCYRLTDKSDVYSFGVVLIELISSLPAVDMDRHMDEINLYNYAMNKIQRCAFDELVDPKLGFISDFKVRRMTTAVAELAFQCLQHDKDFRPSMNEVSEALKRIESADYEALKVAEAETYDGVVNSSKPPPSPAENVYAKMLLHRQSHSTSPNSVMDKWGSWSATPFSSK